MSSDIQTVNSSDMQISEKDELQLVRREQAIRLRRMREDSGLTLDVFAVRCGVRRSSQITYEKATSSPDAEYLYLAAKNLQIDPTFLVTGAVQPPAPDGISSAELGLLKRYRSLTTKQRKWLDECLRLVTVDPEAKP